MSPLFFKRLSDEILGSRLASGEAAAFDEIYRRYANRLAAYGGHLLGDAGLGDDVAQATMLKAYGALREGRVPKRMKPWLFTIAHNVAIDLVVRRRELPSDDLPEAPSGEREPMAGTLVQALATLPDRQRRVYVLREVHGLRIDETAAELELTAAQVEQALFAARNRLAEQLVFGDRLNCVTVQRLAAGPLDTAERRALKTHLRTCNSCRQTLGLRGRALSVFPAGLSLDWLPRLGAGLLTGGAPAVAKVGAVVATATIAAGVPVAVESARHHAHRPILPQAAVHATPVVSVHHVAPAATDAVAVEPLAAVSSSSTIEAARERQASAAHARKHADDVATKRDRSGESKDGSRAAGRSGGDRSGDSRDHGSSSAAALDGKDSGGGSHDGITSSRGSGSDSGDRRSGDAGGGVSTSGKRESGDGHGGDSRGGTVTTPTTTTTTAPADSGGVDGSHGGSDGSGGGDGSGGDSHGGDGGGGTITSPALPVATPDLAVLDSSGH